MTTDSILIIGASGQVGGPLLTVLHKRYQSIPITVFLRTRALDSTVETLSNVSVVHGDFETPEGLALLEEQASKHSIVINTATSRFLDMNEAILRGLEKYKATTSQNPSFVHITGTGNFLDHSETGEFHSNGEVAGLRLPFDDADPAAVRKINVDHMPNGASDEAIMSFANKGKANVYFVCPSAVYGTSKDHVGRLATTEEGRRYATATGLWVGSMLFNIREKGFSPQVGPGKNQFFIVHVDDVVSLTMLVFAKAIRERDGKDDNTGKRGAYGIDDVYSNFYIAAADKHASSEIAEVFAKAAGKLGIADGELHVKSVPYEEAGPIASYLSSNMLIQVNNAKKLGWVPKASGLAETLGA